MDLLEASKKACSPAPSRTSLLKLYQFEPVWGLPNASPFCMKLETYLRMAQLPYEIAPNADIRKAPKGKMPYIEDNGRFIADSSLVIDYLKATYGDPLDRHLTVVERAHALALQRLIEEHFYWWGVHNRWVVEENWRITRAAYFSSLPPPLKWIVPRIARRRALAALYGHGMGRHSPSEIYAFARDDISVLSTWLGEQPFFMGERPTTIDATAYAFLANVFWAPIESRLKDYARTLPNLLPYCERMKARYFADAA